MSSTSLDRTRLSLFYLAGYSVPAGLSLLFAPGLALKMLLSTGTYPDVMVRMVGIPLLGLGIFVVQMIRHRLSVLYPTTLFVRSIILGGLLWLFALSGDRMFLVLVGIVGVGFLLTLGAYASERMDPRSALPKGGARSPKAGDRRVEQERATDANAGR